LLVEIEGDAHGFKIRHGPELASESGKSMRAWGPARMQPTVQND
jgi:hypothetical protein